MPERKAGRKRRPRTTAEKLLMAEFAEQLVAKMEKDPSLTAKSAAAKLKVSLASLYNYKNKADLPSFEVLKRAHDVWGFKFKYLDFAAGAPRRTPSEKEQPRQYILPFIRAVHEGDVKIIETKPIKPDTLQLIVQIRFAS